MSADVKVLYAELNEVKERLARLEEKVDWIVKYVDMCRRNTNNDKFIKWALVTWLSFLSALMGVEWLYGHP